ncbi:ATP-binding protein [Dictyobacter arantiisoli]|uniref:histidine kinase n=1 Tax=Dictyobacter arantiisoli TaxID=2014874 RepID=A0A5A5THU6_9CHLR|nr:ATP-binding protein [Dictyobacter arantiisoli]GCF10947.1 hypothetical protein KDI_45110 [Dictyobacter arantiisoli]
MNAGYTTHLEYILNTLSAGVALLDADTLTIRYVNPYLATAGAALWQSAPMVGQTIAQILPAPFYTTIQPLLLQARESRQRMEWAEVPFEGFLEERGRTYWHITLELHTPASSIISNLTETPETTEMLMITLEDNTNAVRARLQLQAIHAISSALAGPSSLPLVLERILHVLRQMFGSKRCAIFLLDHSLPAVETHLADLEESSSDETAGTPQVERLVAQLGIHQISRDWHAAVDESILLGTVAREHRSQIITDTSTTPQLVFPYLEHQGEPHRPGSVLCVPIFEPQPNQSLNVALDAGLGLDGDQKTVFGTIEVYHLRARGFPAEEVALLEQFAQQAGLAIQNARLFRRIDRLARTASRMARQKDNIMQAMPDGVVIVDPRWRVADINPAACNLMGWDETIRGQDYIEALRHSPAIIQDNLLMQENPTAEIEQRALSGSSDSFKVISMAGRAYSIQVTYTPIRDEVGDIFAFIVIYHDITKQVAAHKRIEAEVVARTAELKQRNQALQAAQIAQSTTSARMALLLERLPSGVILVEAQDNRITVINQQAIDLLQRMGADFIPDDDRPEAVSCATDQDLELILRSIDHHSLTGSLLSYEEHPLYAALKLGVSSEAELQIRLNDGQVLYILANAAPLRAPDGSIESAILVYQEITRLKQLERVREDFFTTMAHELKTPLANIRAHLSALLARDIELSREEQFDYLQTADEQVDRLVGMINHFLDAFRVEAGALRLELEPILLPELFEEVQERLEALMTSAQCTLQINIPESLPAVRGDYEHLLSVLTNLLSNAFRYAPDGDAVQLTASLISDHPKQRPHSVRISVTDHGPGISKEQQVQLFTRFTTFAAMTRPSSEQDLLAERAHRQKATRWSPATGLGLYISHGIIEAHGSQLELTSNPGQGATFAFTLPIYRGKRRQARPVTSPTALLIEGD